MDDCYHFNKSAVPNGFRTTSSTSWRYWLLTLFVMLFSINSNAQCDVQITSANQLQDGMGSWSFSFDAVAGNGEMLVDTSMMLLRANGQLEMDVMDPSNVYVSGAYHDSTMIFKVVIMTDGACVDSAEYTFVHVDPNMSPTCKAEFDVSQNQDQMGTYQFVSNANGNGETIINEYYKMFDSFGGHMTVDRTDSFYVSGSNHNMNITFRQYIETDGGCIDSAEMTVQHIDPSMNQGGGSGCTAGFDVSQNQDQMGTYQFVSNANGNGETIINEYYKMFDSFGGHMTVDRTDSFYVSGSNHNMNITFRQYIETDGGCIDSAEMTVQHIDPSMNQGGSGGSGADDVCDAGYWPEIDGNKIVLKTYSMKPGSNDSIIMATAAIYDSNYTALNGYPVEFNAGDDVVTGDLDHANYITKIWIETEGGCKDTFGLFVNVPNGEYGDPSGNLDPNYVGSGHDGGNGDDGGTHNAYCNAQFDAWQDQGMANTINMNPFEHHYHVYTWTVDGADYYGLNPGAITVSGPGTYNVQLIVQDTVGNCADTSTQTVMIEVAKDCRAEMDMDYAASDSMNVAIFNRSTYSGGNPNFAWSVQGPNGFVASDTTWDVGQTFAFMGTEAGDYTITLIVEDGQCRDTMSTNQGDIVLPLAKQDHGHDSQANCDLSISFAYLQDSTNGKKNTIDFTPNIQGSYTSINWMFGNGDNSDEYAPEYEFQFGGFKDVCVSVYDSLTGCFAETCNGVEVIGDGDPNGGANSNCFASWSASANSTYEIAFSNTSQGDVTNFDWDFGNGEKSSDENPTYTYDAPGYYWVCLNTFDSVSGCHSNFCEQVSVIDTNNSAAICFADFSTFIDVASNTVTFTNKSQGDVTDFHWMFGDGNSSHDANPTHTYHQKGYYNVELSVFDSVSGCQSFMSSEVELLDSNTVACFAEIGFYADAATKTVNFTNNSKGSFTSSWWEFGDGNSSSEDHPTHMYNELGYYHVSLSIQDSVSGCQSYVDMQVELLDSNTVACFASFTTYPDVAAKTVHFTNSSEGNFTSYFWTFGEGGTSTDRDPSYQYHEHGYYWVELTVFDSVSGCQAHVGEQVELLDSNTVACFADFTFYPDLGEKRVFFTNTSDGQFTDYYWTFGDGRTSKDRDPEHQYHDNGYYWVELTVFDSVSGCQAMIGHQVELLDSNVASCFSDFSVFLDFESNTATFENKSEGSITSYWWEFGDGNTSSEMNPTHTYHEKGYYQVSLSTHDSVSGCNSWSEQPVELVDENTVACFAQFSFYPDSETKSVSFTDESMGNFTSYFWTFGDGTTSKDQSPTHQYDNHGYYWVELTVFDSVSGCQGNMGSQVEILDSNVAACFSNFTMFIDFPTKTVTFNNSSEGSITSYWWEFGDGGTSSEMNPVHQYMEPGYYQASLSIYDSVSGCNGWFEQPIELVDENTTACFADFSYYPDAQAKTVSFTNESKGNFTNFHWKFGDGNSSDEENPVHQYAENGFYGVELVVFDSVTGCQGMMHQPVELMDSNSVACFADFTMFIDFPTNTVTFTNASKGSFTNFWWEFGDGNNSDEENPVHQYMEPGYYHASLSVHDSVSGCHGHFDMPVELVDANTTACFADFSYYPDPSNNSVSFTNESMGNITSYYWMFGDGNNSDEENPTHTYDANGFYGVELIVFDSTTGCQGQMHQPVELMDSNAVACFAEFTTFIDFPTRTVTFNNNSKGSFTDYYWEFGDGNTSSDRDPVHVYAEPGFYHAGLSVYDSVSGCQGRFDQPIELVDENTAACFAEFTFYPDVANNTVSFTNESKGNFTEFYWNFGDGNNSNDENPTHTYDAKGFYHVEMSVFDSVSGCQAFFHAPIELLDSNTVACFAQFSVFIDFPTNTVTFNNESEGNFTDYYWEFGDGNTSSDRDPIHVYAEKAYYHVGLSVVDSVSGCQGWFDMPVELVDSNTVACFAEFSFYPDVATNTVHFTNESKGNFTEFYWNFGDGNNSNEESPSHQYAEKGFYGVDLNVFDEVTGCNAHFHQPVELLDSNTVACFAQFSLFIDFPTKTVTFNNESEGNFTDYYWDFGDGNNSSEQNPTHVYDHYDFYHVGLSVYDSVSGCQGYFDQPVELVDDQTAACFAEFTWYPDVETNTVHFTNTSKGNFTEFWWTFGDGTDSKDENPSHTYDAKGFYHVEMAVFDSVSGCNAMFHAPIELLDSNTVACYAQFSLFIDFPTNTVTFNNESEGNFTDYYWDFGDATNSSDRDPVKQYAEKGYYHVSLSVYDSLSGCQGYFDQPVELVDDQTAACLAEFTFYPDAEEKTVHFDNASKGNITSYYWMFGDGNFSDESNPSHQYDELGFYHVELSVFDSVSGCNARFAMPVELMDTNTVACFAQFSLFIDFPTNTVKFNNESEGNFTDFYWEFGDGTNSSERNPVKVYDEKGFYHVSLSVYDSISGCNGHFDQPVELIDTNTVACFAEFSFYPDADANMVHFENLSKGNITSYFWDFGDGNSSDEEHPTHQYDEKGFYGVELTVYDDNSGCNAHFHQPIELIDTNTVACFAEFTFFADIASRTVTFNNSSLGNFTDYYWEFGDGTNSSDRDPVKVYAEEGYYQVGLSVYDSVSGCNGWYDQPLELVDTNTVDCFADFIFFPDVANKSVSFESQAKGAVSRLFWSFGDGRTSSEENPTHTYEELGYYEVTLVTMDFASGCQSEMRQPIELMDTNTVACLAEFSAFLDIANKTVTFNDLSEGNISEYYWSFGDGNSSTEANPTHVYDEEGYYEVCLVVYDASTGCQAEVCHGGELVDTNTVACFADFSFYPDVETMTVTFNNESLGSFTKMFWDFGDGSFSQDENPTKTYAEEGYYDVCLNLYDQVSGCQVGVCLPIELIDTNSVACLADFSFFPDVTTKTVAFTSKSEGDISRYFWNFGDGSFSQEENPTKVYAEEGYYEVELMVFDDASGCQSNKIDPIELIDTNTVACLADFTVFPDVATKTATFTNESQGDVSKYFWNFGDGNFSNEENPTHTYAADGYYEVTLTILDFASGCQEEYTEPVELIDTNTVACLANFSFYPDVATKTAHFTNESQGNITNYFWSFGDGKFSQDENPSHTYAADGYYDVELTVFDAASGCQEAIHEPIEMIDTNSVACLADFTFFPDVATRTVQFSNTSQGNITKQFWSYGDGSFSTEFEGSHTYATQGYYGVELTVFDVTTGCQEQTFADIELIDTNAVACLAGFSFYPDVTNLKVHFTNESQGNISNYHWNFGDGSFSGDTSPVHTYANQGFYRVELTVFDASTGCQEFAFDAVELIDTTTVNCNANFSFYPELSTMTAYFTNESDGTYNKVFWRFGDGNFSDEDSPSHTYANDGFYRVELTVFDSVSGCQSTFYEALEMIDTTQVVCFADFTFFPDATTGIVEFSNVSEGDFTDYHWSFGDGNYSDEESPSHTYAKDGFYKVELTVFDATSGCQAYFHDAVQLIDTTTVSCFAEFDYMPEDRDVHFTDISQGTFDKFYWIFGDGAVSTAQNPTHTYNNDGIYEVSFTIFDEESGCTDNYVDVVEILVDTAEVFCQADFSFYPDETGTVQFTNLSLGTFTNVHWDFGNGNFSNSDTTASNTYGVFGYYEACLTVFDSASGCMHSTCVEVVAGTDDAATTNCQAKFEYFPNGATVDFTDKSLGGYSQVFFDFGDGTNSTDTMPSHTFDGSGYYEVCLTVFDTTTNCFDSYCEFVSVIDTTTSADDNCQAFFTYFPKGNGDIKFQDDSYGQPKEWYWNFGDGTPAGDQKNPTHTYAADGYYEVCLTSTNDAGCQETFCDVIAVGDVSNSCYANYNYYADSVTATGIFNNLSLGEDLTYAWDFGDSSVISALENPRHVYPGVGYYAVCLTVSNAAGCEDIYCNDVNIGNELADKCLFSCVWPGDANGDLEANHYDLLTIGLNYGYSGPARDSVSILGDRGHFAEDWSTFQTNGTNNKHADCDGNGTVELIDTAAIHRYFAYSHYAQYRKGNRAATDLIISVSGDVEANGVVTVDVSTDEDVDLSMYGLGFELGFQDGDIDYNSFSVDWADSWLGDDGVDMIGFHMPQEEKLKLNLSATGIDQMDRTGSGHIATITFNLSSTFSDDNLTLDVYTQGGIDANGDSVSFAGGTATYVPEVEGAEATRFETKPLNVYPNPSNGEIAYNLPAGAEYLVRVYNNMGQVVVSETNNGGLVRMDVTELSNGIYTIHIDSEGTRYQQQISIVH